MQPLETRINECIIEIEKITKYLPGVHTIHNIVEGTIVWMSQSGLEALGVTADEILHKHVKEYHHRFFNSSDSEDYVPKIMGLLKRNNPEEIVTYFEQVKLHGQEYYTWHISGIRILLKNDEDQPVYAITNSMPIDAMHHMTAKASRLLEENNFLRANYQNFAQLSSREREILKHMALGQSSTDTADALFISAGTVDTHRKNIRKKLNTQSYYELTMYARAFDLI